MTNNSTQIRFSTKSQLRAGFLLASILTCGFAIPIWIGYEIVSAIRNR